MEEQEHKEYTATELANRLNDAVNLLHEKSVRLARLAEENKHLYDMWQEGNVKIRELTEENRRLRRSESNLSLQVDGLIGVLRQIASRSKYSGMAAPYHFETLLPITEEHDAMINEASFALEIIEKKEES